MFFDMHTELIKPYQKDAALLADIASVEKDRGLFHVWWLGQSGFLISWQGQRLLFDPYLSDSLTRKYADTDKPHVRMTEQVIAPEQLPSIELVTSSHNHTDHLDKETLRSIMGCSPALEMIVPEANRAFVADRLEVAHNWPQGLCAGESRCFSSFELHAVPAAHEGLDCDAHGRNKYLGYVVRFGSWTVYHSGDTVIFDGMERLLQQWSIDLALLPINGRLPERRVAGNMWGSEAAELGKAIGAACVIPCHYDMFAFNTETPRDFLETCESLGQTCKVLRAGERWSSPAVSV